jgi:hypothetical protein
MFRLRNAASARGEAQLLSAAQMGFFTQNGSSRQITEP